MLLPASSQHPHEISVTPSQKSGEGITRPAQVAQPLRGSTKTQTWGFLSLTSISFLYLSLREVVSPDTTKLIDLGALVLSLLEAAFILLRKCTLLGFFWGPVKRQNLKAHPSLCGRHCHFQHWKLLHQPPPKALSRDLVTFLLNYTGWFKNRVQGFPRQERCQGAHF